MKLDQCLTPHTIINFKWIKYLDVESETIKFFEENTGSKFLDIGLGDFFFFFNLAMTAEISKWDYIKLKSFCTVKETINKMKRQPNEWEKISSNYGANIISICIKRAFLVAQ